MRSKYKMTGCAKFLLFLLFFAPIAYFGSSLINEKGGVDGFKDKIANLELPWSDDNNEPAYNDADNNIELLKEEINTLKKENRKLRLEVQYLESKLEEAKQ